SVLLRMIFESLQPGLGQRPTANDQRRCYKLSVILPRGFHPFPSRTRKLSPAGPIVLHAKVCGRVGRRRHKIKADLRNQVGLFLFGGERYAGRRSRAMASLDWSQCSAVESIPGKVSGAWVLKGTRMPVSAIFENLDRSEHRQHHGMV